MDFNFKRKKTKLAYITVKLDPSRTKTGSVNQYKPLLLYESEPELNL